MLIRLKGKEEGSTKEIIQKEIDQIDLLLSGFFMKFLFMQERENIL